MHSAQKKPSRIAKRLHHSQSTEVSEYNITIAFLIGMSEYESTNPIGLLPIHI